LPRHASNRPPPAPVDHRLARRGHVTAHLDHHLPSAQRRPQQRASSHLITPTHRLGRPHHLAPPLVEGCGQWYQLMKDREVAANEGHGEVHPTNEVVDATSFVLLCSQRARRRSTVSTPTSSCPVLLHHPPKAAFHPNAASSHLSTLRTRSNQHGGDVQHLPIPRMAPKMTRRQCFPYTSSKTTRRQCIAHHRPLQSMIEPENDTEAAYTPPPAPYRPRSSPKTTRRRRIPHRHPPTIYDRARK